MKVVIAGASGFVGKALISRLLQDPSYQVRALARSLPFESKGNLETRPCDLFSLLDVERNLEGQDEAIYLVHSMLPSSQLSQGNFADYDLILADNFARAAKKNGIKRILYLGGIIPLGNDSQPEKLSPHLRSRLEVEKVFRSYGIPVLALRAGIVMGKDGSSFQMILRLVRRLPMMICPAWTKNKSSPIHVRDVAESFYFALKTPNLQGSFDLEGGQSLSYLQMLERCSKKMHKKRFFFDIPFFSPQLSKLWVRAITGAPKNLVYPLVDSLNHNMLPTPDLVFRIPGWKYITFDEALDEALNEMGSRSVEPTAYKTRVSEEHLQLVQSVQRHPLPVRKSAEWASGQYVIWLNKNFRGLISVETKENKTRFFFLKTKLLLLELSMSKDRSSENRVLFYITDGLLVKKTKRARLEFRVTPDGKYLITAVHEYKPRLPWYIYKYTQAIIHSSVMRRFGRSLLVDSN